jgi:pyruvate/2-oxoglutarate dehydrogenase complex dihydrolipoamide acyltransferase (E2) component
MQRYFHSTITVDIYVCGTDVVCDSSNGGVLDSLFGTLIANLPQATVRGMHVIKDKPVVVNGQIVVRPVMVVALTYGLGLTDGREAVTFFGYQAFLRSHET